MNIMYKFVTGERIEIEVSEGIGEILMGLNKDIYNNDQRETRRHKSYCHDNDRESVWEDLSEDLEAKVFCNLDYEALHRGIKKLLPQQQVLVHKAFFEGKLMVEVAKELGISKQACNNRLNKIYAQLKKYF